jgi:hypothetical protein
MICPTCGQEMTAFGCRVSDRPFHHCANCGTAKPCDDTPFLVPILVERKLAEQTRHDMQKEDEARAFLRRLRAAARQHVHEAGQPPNPIDRCELCGRDLRDDIHTRAEGKAPADELTPIVRFAPGEPTNGQSKD